MRRERPCYIFEVWEILDGERERIGLFSTLDKAKKFIEEIDKGDPDAMDIRHEIFRHWLDAYFSDTDRIYEYQWAPERHEEKSGSQNERTRWTLARKTKFDDL